MFVVIIGRIFGVTDFMKGEEHVLLWIEHKIKIQHSVDPFSYQY